MSDDDLSGLYGLAPIRLEHKPVFDAFLSTCRTRLSDYTFANTFVWRDCVRLRWKVLKDCLCVFANGDGGLTLLLPPVGPGDVPVAAREALDLCDDYIATHRVAMTSRIEYVSDEMLEHLGPGFAAETMSGDYVYPTARMIDLAGGDLASKRHARNRFAKNYAARTETFEPRHVEPCMRLLDRWHEQCQAQAAGENEESPGVHSLVAMRRAKDVLATREALRNFDALGLTGMVLYADDDLVGFTFGELLGGDTCNILIEKTDRAYNGAAQFIFSEFCRQHWAHTQWCNAGDDWDIPSLAWTKQSYRPAHRLGKWVVRAVSAPAMSMHTPEPQEARDFVVSLADLCDLKRLHEIERACFDEEVATTRRQLRYLVQSPRASVYVLRHGQNVLASSMLLRRRTRGGLVGRLYSMAVDPVHRGRGFGRFMLDHCIDTFRAEGATAIHLEVDVRNTVAIRLYEQGGFTRLRRLRDYYGDGLDGWKMVLRLVERSTRAVRTPASEPVTVAQGVALTV